MLGVGAQGDGGSTLPICKYGGECGLRPAMHLSCEAMIAQFVISAVVCAGRGGGGEDGEGAFEHRCKLVGIEDNLRTIVGMLSHEVAGEGAAGGPIDWMVTKRPGSERLA